MSEYGLLVAFPDQSETFVLGFEAGQLFEAMKYGPADLTMHTANEEVFRRIARHYGYDVSFKPLGNGWSEAQFSRGRPQLRSVGKNDRRDTGGICGLKGCEERLPPDKFICDQHIAGAAAETSERHSDPADCRPICTKCGAAIEIDYIRDDGWIQLKSHVCRATANVEYP